MYVDFRICIPVGKNELSPFTGIAVKGFHLNLSAIQQVPVKFKRADDRFSTKSVYRERGHFFGLLYFFGKIKGFPEILVGLGFAQVNGLDFNILAVIENHDS